MHDRDAVADVLDDREVVGISELPNSHGMLRPVVGRARFGRALKTGAPLDDAQTFAVVSLARWLLVVMDETLAGALAALFKETAPASPPSASLPPEAPAKPSLAGPEADRAREALSHYNRAIEQLKSGNWGGFGAELDALRPLLEELSAHSAGR